MRFRPSEPRQVPAELLAVYAKNGRRITAASVSDDGRWKITTDSGRTVVWTRVDAVHPWRAKLEVAHAE